MDFVNPQTSDAGSYSVAVSNTAGSVTSSTATLTVLSSATDAAPTIIQQPTHQTAPAGGTATFSVVANGTPTPTYQWFNSGNQPIAGATSSTLTLTNVQLVDNHTYYVRATNSAGSVDSNSAQLTVTPFDGVTRIVQQPVSQTVARGGTAAFSVVVDPSSGRTFQWYKNNQQVTNATTATLSLFNLQPGDAGTYYVRVVAPGNFLGTILHSDSATLTVTTEVSALAGTYFGTLGPDGLAGNFAVVIRADGIGAMLLSMPGLQSAIVITNFTVNPDGTFNVAGLQLTPANTGRLTTAEFGTNPQIAADLRTITGSVTMGGNISGVIAGLSLAMNGSKSVGSVASAGYYQAPAVGGAAGNVYTIVAPDGKGLLVAQTATTVESGVGVVDSGGKLSVATTSGAMVTGSLDSNTGSIAAAADKGALAGTTFNGLRDDVPRTDRLFAISTRGRVETGDEVLIPGFIISGNEPRMTLLRGVGPALREAGLSAALADSRIELYRDSTKIGENDDWGTQANVSELIAATTRVGLTNFSANSKDAALLVVLDPGAYTALVSGKNNSTGLALVEVYDAGTGPSNGAAPKFVAISTRGYVGPGDDLLIGGFAITGNSPKRVLLRGVSSSLKTAGLNGTLDDPVLKIFSGSTQIAHNDDWSGNSEIATATVSVGLAPLAANSKDACLLVTLAPGGYTAQVLGKGDSSGIAIVEIYEVSN